MKNIHYFTFAAVMSAGTLSSTAASVSVSGLVETLSGFDGNTIRDGSRVEIGYFLGVDSSKDPNTYSLADWSSFELLGTTSTGTVFFGLIDGGVDLEGTRFDSETDFATGLPVRVGLRIFDDLDSGRFNTFTTGGNNAILELPDDFVPGSGDADLTTEGSQVFWEDSANPFQTSIAVPEPTTFFSTLVGLGLLAGRRRRA
jgi:hypothetical protein